MWFLTRIAILFYVTILWVSSLCTILFTLQLLDLKLVEDFLELVYYDFNARIITGGIAIGFILISFMLETLIYGSRKRERNIAFYNPSGAVTVSLSAIEDLIKRLISHVEEVQDVRPAVLLITQKGLDKDNNKALDIDIKLVLKAEVNIPELTARLQDLVKRKIEELIGLEGKLNIHMHVVKISLDDIKARRGPLLDDPQVPFHGYRA